MIQLFLYFTFSLFVSDIAVRAPAPKPPTQPARPPSQPSRPQGFGLTGPSQGNSGSTKGFAGPSQGNSGSTSGSRPQPQGGYGLTGPQGNSGSPFGRVPPPQQMQLPRSAPQSNLGNTLGQLIAQSQQPRAPSYGSPGPSQGNLGSPFLGLNSRPQPLQVGSPGPSQGNMGSSQGNQNYSNLSTFTQPAPFSALGNSFGVSQNYGVPQQQQQYPLQQTTQYAPVQGYQSPSTPSGYTVVPATSAQLPVEGMQGAQNNPLGQSYQVLPTAPNQGAMGNPLGNGNQNIVPEYVAPRHQVFDRKFLVLKNMYDSTVTIDLRYNITPESDQPLWSDTIRISLAPGESFPLLSKIGFPIATDRIRWKASVSGGKYTKFENNDFFLSAGVPPQFTELDSNGHLRYMAPAAATHILNMKFNKRP